MTGVAAPQAEDVEIEPHGVDPLAVLARDAVAGNRGAFDLLAANVSRRLLAFAQQVLPGSSLAEDAVQESLVRIYRFLPSYAGGSFISWCLTITQRVCMDMLRSERRQAPQGGLDGPVPTDPTEASDLRAVVLQVLQELRPPLRIAFLLRLQGLTYAEIATAMEIPVGTVRSRLFEARRQLQESLAIALEWRIES